MAISEEGTKLMNQILQVNLETLQS